MWFLALYLDSFLFPSPPPPPLWFNMQKMTFCKVLVVLVVRWPVLFSQSSITMCWPCSISHFLWINFDSISKSFHIFLHMMYMFFCVSFHVVYFLVYLIFVVVVIWVQSVYQLMFKFIVLAILKFMFLIHLLLLVCLYFSYLLFFTLGLFCFVISLYRSDWTGSTKDCKRRLYVQTEMEFSIRYVPYLS